MKNFNKNLNSLKKLLKVTRQSQDPLNLFEKNSKFNLTKLNDFGNNSSKVKYKQEKFRESNLIMAVALILYFLYWYTKMDFVMILLNVFLIFSLLSIQTYNYPLLYLILTKINVLMINQKIKDVDLFSFYLQLFSFNYIIGLQLKEQIIMDSIIFYYQFQIPDQQNLKLICFAMIFQFFLERKQKMTWVNEKQLQLSRNNFYKLFQQNQNPLVLIDSKQKIILNNKNFEDLYQLSQNDSFTDLINQKHQQKFQKILDAAYGEQQIFQLKNFQQKEKNSFLIVKQIIFRDQQAFLVSFFQNSVFLNIFKQSGINQAIILRQISSLHDNIEQEFVKWHNLQSLKMVKESDLKNQASCLYENNLIKQNLEQLQELFNLYFTNEQQIKSHLQDFNLKNSIIQTLELCFFKIQDSKIEISLTFDDQVPQIVTGNLDRFQNLFWSLLKIILQLNVEEKNLATTNIDQKKYQQNSSQVIDVKVKVNDLCENKLDVQFEFNYYSEQAILVELEYIQQSLKISENIDKKQYVLNEIKNDKDINPIDLIQKIIIPIVIIKLDGKFKYQTQDNKLHIVLNVPFQSCEINTKTALKRKLIPSISNCRQTVSYNTYTWKKMDLIGLNKNPCTKNDQQINEQQYLKIIEKPVNVNVQDAKITDHQQENKNDFNNINVFQIKDEDTKQFFNQFLELKARKFGIYKTSKINFSYQKMLSNKMMQDIRRTLYSQTLCTLLDYFSKKKVKINFEKNNLSSNEKLNLKFNQNIDNDLENSQNGNQENKNDTSKTQKDDEKNKYFNTFSDQTFVRIWKFQSNMTQTIKNAQVKKGLFILVGYDLQLRQAFEQIDNKNQIKIKNCGNGFQLVQLLLYLYSQGQSVDTIILKSICPFMDIDTTIKNVRNIERKNDLPQSVIINITDDEKNHSIDFWEQQMQKHNVKVLIKTDENCKLIAKNIISLSQFMQNDQEIIQKLAV